jgi:hypothetical protein
MFLLGNSGVFEKSLASSCLLPASSSISHIKVFKAWGNSVGGVTVDREVCSLLRPCERHSHSK